MSEIARTRRWNAVDTLGDEAERAAYLEAAFEDGDAGVIAAALGDVARAIGMTELARRTGLGRESLYKSLSPAGNPELATVLRIVSALGLRLRAEPVAKRTKAVRTTRTTRTARPPRPRPASRAL